MEAEKYLGSIGLESVIGEEFFNDDDKSYYTVQELMESYHQYKLNESKWISVKDRLPEEKRNGFSDFVLTSSEKFVHKVDRYDYDNKCWLLSNSPFITHWQPLPNPPTD